MFVRFVAGSDVENAFWLTGVFTEARLLREAGRLYAHEVELLAETYAWFNQHLPCPPFEAMIARGRWTADAVAWFRDDAGECIRRIWDLVHLLRENSVPVRLIATERPGKIVCQDRFQIVAETPPWA
jgi:hypothetical protein